MNNKEQLFLHLQDNEWPPDGITHDRIIVRAIVIDENDFFYFVRVNREDAFGKATLIETAGGGVEPGENLTTALHREIREELGAEVNNLCKIGMVSDYYHLIHRHNLNHYYLCQATSFGRKHLTKEEIENFHLSTEKLRYEEAIQEYETCAVTRLGRLIANRELPILRRAKELLGR